VAKPAHQSNAPIRLVYQLPQETNGGSDLGNNEAGVPESNGFSHCLAPKQLKLFYSCSLTPKFERCRKMERKDYLHNPTHIFADDTPYFITAAIYQKRPLLKGPELKQLLLDRIKLCFDKYQWELHHWVILDNHYHLLGKSRVGEDLPKIITNVHAFTGYYIKQVSQPPKRVWWNYWDYCPRHERDYMIRLIYLLHNPVKHGYVDDLYNYQISSFHDALVTQGPEKLRQQFNDYPEFRTLALQEAEEDDF